MKTVSTTRILVFLLAICFSCAVADFAFAQQVPQCGTPTIGCVGGSCTTISSTCDAGSTSPGTPYTALAVSPVTFTPCVPGTTWDCPSPLNVVACCSCTAYTANMVSGNCGDFVCSLTGWCQGC